MSSVKFFTALIGAFCVSTAASAHPGPKLLTQFGGADRSDIAGETSVEDINGVHLYRGPRKLEEDALAGGPTDQSVRYRKEIDIVVNVPFRRIRRLRTQGFYSGTPYPSRRFTQGFYSGR